MTLPDELKSEAPLQWSYGRGVEVWRMLRAAGDGDVARDARPRPEPDPAPLRLSWDELARYIQTPPKSPTPSAEETS